MGKNRSASGITNVIQYDNNGNITFVSGSTTLMQVSSSGAITTTGVISGSNALSASYALNSALLNGTGSVGFATTASLLTVSSSQQQISASQQQLSSSFLTLTASFNAVSASQQQISSSYTALSASYNVFSGSASTRITANSSSIQQVSASQQQISSSQQQISSSLLNVISIGATTGSNSFRANQSITGSLVVSSTITAQTLVVQTVTSSIVYSSGSNIFGCDLNSRQTFTGSVLITGSLTIAGASSATSYSGATIYGSTAVCSAVGKFTSCIDAGSGNFSGKIFALRNNIGTGTTDDADISLNVSAPSGSGKFIMFGRDSANTAVFSIASSGHLGGPTATFSSTVCAPTFKGGSFNGTTGYFSCHIELNDNGSGWIYAYDKNHSIIMRGDRNGCAADYTNYYQYGGNLSTGKGHNFWTDGVLASQTIKMQIANNGICMTVPLYVCTNGSAFGTAASSGQAMTIQASSNCRAIIFKNAGGGDGSLWLYGTSNSIDYNFSTYSVGSAFYLCNNGNYDFYGSDISDRRQKDNICYITDSQIYNIMKLKSVSFNKKTLMGGLNNNVHTGFIAQDVLEAGIPNLVHGKEEEGYGLDYNGILSLTVKAIQEQQCTINTLKTCLGIA